MAINTPREIVQSQIATANAASPVGAEVMANAQGRSRATNEAVQVSSNPADLTDALEELGQMRAGMGKRDLEKMKMRRGAGTDLEALGRIADYYDKLPGLPVDQKHRDVVLTLQSFAEAFRDGDGDGDQPRLPTADDIRRLLREADGDVSHQFAMLEEARVRFAGADPAFLAVLDEVRGDMREDGTAQDIRAGFASAREAHDAADRFAASAEAFRDSYRELVRASGHMGRVFDALGAFSRLGESSREDFEAVLDSFIKVAGDDMKSFGRSADPVILGAVVQELTVLKNLRTALDMADAMLGTLRRMFPDAADGLPDSTAIASDLLHFAASPVASSVDAERMVARFETANPEVPVIAINALRDIHARLPDSVMPGGTARLAQADVLMALSDRYVAAEEASLARE